MTHLQLLWNSYGCRINRAFGISILIVVERTAVAQAT